MYVDNAGFEKWGGSGQAVLCYCTKPTFALATSTLKICGNAHVKY